MNQLPAIWLDDEYAIYTFQDRKDGNPAVEWLEAEFSYRWITSAFLDDELVPGSACIRPMLEIIDQLADAAEDKDGPMVICQSDYDDPGRWWL